MERQDRDLETKFAYALNFAGIGDITSMSWTLDRANECARLAGRDITAEVAVIESLGYGNAVDRRLADAIKYAENGNASLMSCELDRAGEYARFAGRDITAKVAEIESLGYKQGVEKEVATALQYAEAGNVSVMGWRLNQAKRYAQLVGQDITEKIDIIESFGYLMAVNNEFATARQYAEAGNVSVMGCKLDRAGKYARHIGMYITAEVAEIESLGYRNAVDIGLAEALKYAGKGDASSMSCELDRAGEYARHVGRDITAKMVEIESLGYKKGVETELAKALRFAQEGGVVLMVETLSLASNYAAFINLDIDDRIAEVITALKK